jgi:CHAT domain-containing protein
LRIPTSPRKARPRQQRASAQKADTVSSAASVKAEAPGLWPGSGIDRAQLGEQLPRLANSADEVRKVARNVGATEADLHFRTDASETAVKATDLSRYRIVYFATHGLVAGDVKHLDEPALALSLPERPTELDDGLLIASEISRLRLDADFVVLSACNTASGGRPGAPALSGLARAMFYAGGRSLLVSHWEVQSDAATRLTTDTFDALKANPQIGRAEALRRAMLSLMNDTSDPDNALPATWAPFQLIGE